MNLEQLTNEVNNLFYNDTSSYKTIASIQKELLAVLNPRMDIKNIDRKCINKYFNYLKASGNKPTTINNKMMYISKNLNYALKSNLIKHKPLIPTIKNINKRTITISETEYQSMLSYALSNNLQELYQTIVIGYNTGMRVSNILALSPEDIDNNYIRIWRNKTNTPYSIPLNHTLQEQLKNFKEFTLNYRQLQYQFQTMVKSLHLDSRITIHTLRHTTCTTLIKKGVPIAIIQKLMNHKNISTTMLYTHIKDSELEQAVNML